LLEQCYAWRLDFLYPDGSVPPINDAHVGELPFRSQVGVAAERYGNLKARRYLVDHPGTPPEEERGFEDLFSDRRPQEDTGAAYAVDSIHLKGSGLMVLRNGADAASRTMAFLDYGAYEPPNKPPYHKHRDYLNLGLWAAGREMLSEMGYAMTPPWVQKWQVSPMAHNSVLEAAAQKEGGQPLLWQITPGPKLAEAGLPPANSRFIALLPRASGEPVIVDIFRVSGYAGSFTWAVHTKSSDLEVRGIEAWKPAEVETPLRNGRQAVLPIGTVETVWRFPGSPAAGLKMLLTGEGQGSLFVSECPPEEDEIAAGFMKGGTPKPGAVLPYRGHIQVKKGGPEAVFVAVYAPYAGGSEPKVEVASKSLEGGTVALSIEISGERFVLIHSAHVGKAEFEGLTLDGRVGIASWRDGKLLNLTLGEGRALKCGQTGVYRSTIGNGFRSMD
jgi:hypothetical protein